MGENEEVGEHLGVLEFQGTDSCLLAVVDPKVEISVSEKAPELFVLLDLLELWTGPGGRKMAGKVSSRDYLTRLGEQCSQVTRGWLGRVTVLLQKCLVGKAGLPVVQG